MGIAGSISPGGGAPRPDPERVATLRYTLVDDAQTCAAFGEEVRASLAELNDRALAETSGAPLDEASLLVGRIRDCIADLDPARLEPRRGLAGLFDSRSKRLKAFRATFLSTGERVAATAADIGGRASALTARDTALDALWSQTRDAIADLDAHVAAARDWLAQETAEPAAAPEPDLAPETSAAEPVTREEEAPAVEPESVAEAEPTAVPALEASIEPETAPEPEPEPEPQPEPAAEATVAALPHPLLDRIAALETARATAITQLPRIRAAQNADWRTPSALGGAADAVQAWREDWRTRLGLAGKKAKKIRPDGAALRAASAALADRIEAAEHELATARARRAEIGLAA